MTRAGAGVAHLEPGDRFGGLDLLRGELARTGTVRAAANAALHVGVVGRHRFLAAVTGFASSAKPADVEARLPVAATAAA